MRCDKYLKKISDARCNDLSPDRINKLCALLVGCIEAGGIEPDWKEYPSTTRFFMAWLQEHPEPKEYYMDPDALLALLNDLLFLTEQRSANKESIEETCQDLFDWLQMDGAEPRWLHEREATKYFMEWIKKHDPAEDSNG